MRMNRFLFPAIIASFFCVTKTPGQEPSAVPQAVENEVKRRLDADRLDRAHRDLTALIAKTEYAVSKLQDIETRASTLDSRLTNLLTDDEGKRIAQDFAAANTILRLREQPLAYSADLKSKKEAAQSLLALLQKEAKNPNVGYQPPEKTILEVEDLYGWSRDRSAELAARESTVQDVVAKASASPLPPNAATLAQVLDAYVAARLRLWAELMHKGEDIGREQTKPVMIEAARLAELERTEAKVNDIKAQAKIDADKIRQDYELRLQEATRQKEELRVKAEIADKDAKAEIERLTKAADAARFAETVKSEIQSGEVVSAAEHERRIAKAKTAEVQTRLKPFLAKGYWQPGEKKRGIDSNAMSLAAIRSFGALDPSSEGLQKLLSLGCGKGPQGGKNGNDRSDVWGHPSNLSKLKPNQLEELKLAQKDIIELGEVMVELGMLAP